MKTRSIFQKSLRTPVEGKTLKKGSGNKKLGFVVSSKKWKGKRLYSLTLEERTTCPTTCHHWIDCYGNNMPFAHRFTPHNIDIILEREIETLLAKHKHGIVVRLHVLGDFYSVDYVQFWQEMLEKHSKLCLFGYTARKGDNIAHAIWRLNNKYPDRCVIRHSGNKAYDGKLVPTQGPFKENWSYAAEESFEGASFDCPEQTGKVKDCVSCGLCWMTTKTVRFATH